MTTTTPQPNAPAGAETRQRELIQASRPCCDEAVDSFIDRLLARLTVLGYDTTNCDGDDDQAIIIADWMHGQRWPDSRAVDALRGLTHLGQNAAVCLSSACEHIESRIMSEQVEELGVALGAAAAKAREALATIEP